MPLKNYTTQISAMKSIGEIQGKLIAHGAKDINLHLGDDREPESLYFSVDVGEGTNLPFRLPQWLPLLLRPEAGQRTAQDEISGKQKLADRRCFEAIFKSRY